MESAALFSSSPFSLHRQLQLSPSASYAAAPQTSSSLCLKSRSSLHSEVPASAHGLTGTRILVQPATSLGLRRRLAPIFASSAASAVPSPASDSSATSPPISDIVWPAAGSFLAMYVMAYVDKLVEPMGLSFTIAPFGAVCAVLFATPTTPAAKKYNMFVAHIGCAAMGIAALALFGPGWLARGTALAASIVFMQLTGSMHPPAAGLPLLFIDVPKFHQLQLWYLIFPSAVGCVLLCVLQELVLFLRRKCRF